jgi:PhoH-like ATPase
MQPWVQPVYDLLEFLMGINSRASKNSGRSYKELVDLGYVNVEVLSYLRGKTLENKFIIIDDAQNMSVSEMKTILTRVGKKSRIILTGDRTQCDNPKLNSENNGFVVAMEKFKNNVLSGHVYLHESQRSIIAQAAAELL